MKEYIIIITFRVFIICDIMNIYKQNMSGLFSYCMPYDKIKLINNEIIVDNMSQMKKYINVYSEDIIHLCCQYCNIDILKYVINYWIKNKIITDIHCLDHIIIGWLCETMDIHLLKYLIEIGEYYNSKYNIYINKPNSIIASSYYNISTKVLEYLIELSKHNYYDNVQQILIFDGVISNNKFKFNDIVTRRPLLFFIRKNLLTNNDKILNSCDHSIIRKYIINNNIICNECDGNDNYIIYNKKYTMISYIYKKTEL